MNDALDHHLGEDLGALADGGRGLSPERKAELERHVESCAACRRAITSAKMVLETVDAARPPASSEGFDRALFARLDRIDRESRPSLADALRAWFTLPRIAAVSAVAAGIAIGVVTLRGPPAEEKLLTAEIAQNLEGLALAEDLDLYQDLELVEELDAIEELDVIEAMELGEPG